MRSDSAARRRRRFCGFVWRVKGKRSKRGIDGATHQPVAVEVTTAAAIKRELPRFFEATGSLAGDQQTDVAPQTSGKVVAVGVDIGSPVRRGQMLVRLDDAELKLRVDQAVAQVGQARQQSGKLKKKSV